MARHTVRRDGTSTGVLLPYPHRQLWKESSVGILLLLFVTIMASYLQSFLATSSMPKRLLHYALSRLEIVDTDALDLQNLDISWGTKNKFEFTDVGLRLKV